MRERREGGENLIFSYTQKQKRERECVHVAASFSLLSLHHYMFCTMSDESVLFFHYIWNISCFHSFSANKQETVKDMHKQTHKYVYNHTLK